MCCCVGVLLRRGLRELVAVGLCVAGLVGGERREHRVLQGGDVHGVGDHHARAVGLASVPGQHRPGRGRDVQAHLAEAVRHRQGRAGQARWDRIVVAAERDQRLSAHHPGHREGRGERRWQRREQPRLGAGERADCGLQAVALAGPTVALPGAEGVRGRLRHGHGEPVRDGAPPALRGAVVGLLHAAFAVAVPWWAELDVHAVVLGDRGERRGDPAGVRARDRGHPVEPPRLRQAAGPAADDVQALDQVRVVLSVSQIPAPASRARQRPDEQMRPTRQAPTEVLRADRARVGGRRCAL